MSLSAGPARNGRLLLPEGNAGFKGSQIFITRLSVRLRENSQACCYPGGYRRYRPGPVELFARI